MLQWKHRKSGQIFNFSVSVYKMFLQMKKRGGNNEKKPQTKRSYLPAPITSSSVSSCLLQEWKATPECLTNWERQKVKLVEPQIMIFLNHPWQALKVQPADCYQRRWLSKSCLHCLKRKGGRRMGDHCVGFSIWICSKMQSGGRNWLSSISFLAAEGMN